MSEFYSRGSTSAHASDAEAAGRLRARPVVATPVVRLDGFDYVVRDVWVEQAYHAEYPMFLWRREVLEDQHFLVMRLEPADSAAAKADAPSNRDGWPSWAPGRTFGSTSGDLWTAAIDPPFPDTVRITFPAARAVSPPPPAAAAAP